MQYFKAEFYGITYKFDIKIIIKMTLRKIFGFANSLILYTDSKLLYNNLV